ncbi:sulfurtransferase complex subunit TusB [Psychromonas sp.]|nr:sulfurtransferase complex subunit TusB [Psychromonas sp.]
MILHTVNHSPFSSFALQDCLKQLGDTDYLLLTGDAVIAVTVPIESKSYLFKLDQEKRLFVLQADINARGLTASYGTTIDYSDFVRLSIECKSQLAW